MHWSPDAKKRIEAVNMIAEYCQEQMPDGWELVFRFSKTECSADLINPDGEEVDGWQGDSETVAEACDYAVHEEAIEDGGV